MPDWLTVNGLQRHDRCCFEAMDRECFRTRLRSAVPMLVVAALIAYEVSLIWFVVLPEYRTSVKETEPRDWPASTRVVAQWVGVGTNVITTNANGDLTIMTSNAPLVLDWRKAMHIVVSNVPVMDSTVRNRAMR